jgi:ABC-2 type transport system permease protein
MNAQSLLWSVRREFWENRSLYIAPLIVAALLVVVAPIGVLAGLNSRPDQFASHVEIGGAALMATMLIVAIFYCLDALYGERRDRSVLFWKSMPVSDVTAVLSKMSVPLLVLPIVTFAITLVAQFLMLLTCSAVLLITGKSAAAFWALPWLSMTAGLLHHLVTVHALYYAPIFGWLLLVSAWAKRLPFLWAFLPPVGISIVERMIFNTNHFAAMLGSRISGGMEGEPAKGSLMIMWPANPLEFLTRPGLWIGFAIAAVCLAGAIRLRRYRDPI